MRIIHYIDGIEAGKLLSDHFLRLATAQQEYAEVRIVTRRDDFKRVSDEFHADIVHIHTCWDYKAARCAAQAVGKGCPVVLSPHWGLDRHTRMAERKLTKHIKAILYQKRMVQQADAILVSSEHEKKDILRLGWTERIGVVADCVLDRQQSDDAMAHQAVDFYRKVLDTRYQLAMTAMEKDAIPSLLHAGLAQETTHNLLSSEQLLNLRSLNPGQWQRILLYADDEGVRDIIGNGINRLQLNAPDIDTTAIRRYALSASKNTNSVDAKELSGSQPLMRQRLNDNLNREETLIRQIVIMLANTRQVERKRSLALRQLADLYTAIKYNDYDEDRLAEVLRHLRIYRYARRIIQLLAEKVQLKEGFMPFPPLNDRQTRRILRKNFTQRH